MAFAWDELLALAKELSQKRTEAASRSAINRAYYAAYQTARHHRGCRTAQITRGGSHKDIWMTLRDSGNAHWHRAGNQGFEILRYRLEADYDDPVAGLTPKMFATLRMAGEILRALQ